MTQNQSVLFWCKQSLVQYSTVQCTTESVENVHEGLHTFLKYWLVLRTSNWLGIEQYNYKSFNGYF